jgi:biotin carboxyl carrier protein
MAEVTDTGRASEAAASRIDTDLDPRAVRLTLLPADDDPAGMMRVSPPPQIPSPPGSSDGTETIEAPVLAQRHLLVDGSPERLEVEPLGHGRYRVTHGAGVSVLVLGPATGTGTAALRREVLVDGFRFEVEVESERIATLRERATRGREASAHAGPLEVRAIIPGKVVSVSAAAGDAVVAGQQLLVVEAMKMQNELRAPRDGTIDRVGVAPGVNIEVGDLLVVIS